MFVDINVLERMAEVLHGFVGSGYGVFDRIIHGKGMGGYSTKKVEYTLEQLTIQALQIFCDADTNAHAQRLVGLAEDTYKSLKLPEQDIHLMRLAALLHDAGKIGVPMSILYKPGVLNTEEQAIMRLHPQLGQYILCRAGGIFEQVASIVVAHHECWDGSGYPYGLSGEEIPLLARILAVVDSYDAMVSCRAYGKVHSSSSACMELELCAGRRYDPCIVAAFLAVLDARGRRNVVNNLPKRNRVEDVPELVDEERAMLLPRSGEYALVSA